MDKTILDGIWQFGFQEGDCDEPLSIPMTTVAAVPGCYDAGELFSKRGFGVYAAFGKPFHRQPVGVRARGVGRPVRAVGTYRKHARVL